jgi:hypothetical protein
MAEEDANEKYGRIVNEPSTYPTVVLAGDALVSQIDALIGIAAANTTWAFKRGMIKALFDARVAGSLRVLEADARLDDLAADATDEQVVRAYAAKLTGVKDWMARGAFREI